LAREPPRKNALLHQQTTVLVSNRIVDIEHLKRDATMGDLP
jgi:hypothetical protein